MSAALRGTHTGKARIPYATIREYTGIGSDGTVKEKLDELLERGWTANKLRPRD